MHFTQTNRLKGRASLVPLHERPPSPRRHRRRQRHRPRPGREIASHISSLKGEAMNWFSDPSYGTLRLRLENAHAASEATMVEARRRVRFNEGVRRC